MLDHETPDLDAMLGGLMSADATAPPSAPAQQPQFKTVAQAQAEAAGVPYVPQPAVVVQAPAPSPASSPMPVHVQQAVALANAADPFNVLYGVAEQNTPKEFSEALAAAAVAAMEGSSVENALGVAAHVISQRLQEIHDVDRAVAYELTQYALVAACSQMIADILDRKIFKGKVARQAEYRRDLVLRAIKRIQVANADSGIRGVTVANILNRIGRKRWSGDDVQVIVDDLVNTDEIEALPLEAKPGRKSVRYIIKEH